MIGPIFQGAPEPVACLLVFVLKGKKTLKLSFFKSLTNQWNRPHPVKQSFPYQVRLTCLVQFFLPREGHFLHKFFIFRELFLESGVRLRCRVGGVFEHHFECVHLCPELPDDPSVGVFVDHGVIDDTFGSVSVTQSRQGFLKTNQVAIYKRPPHLIIGKNKFGKKVLPPFLHSFQPCRRI